MSTVSASFRANPVFRLHVLVLSLTAMVVFLAPQARAQLSVTLQTNKTKFVQHEGILVTLSVRNTSGRALVLEGPSGSNWYTFQVTDRTNKLLAPYRAVPKSKPIFIKQGETISRQVILTDYYSIREMGRYRFTAGVYFRGLSRYIKSNEARVDVHPAKRIWTDVSGARGPGGLTRYIRYSLMMFTTSKGKEAYVKLEDEKKGTVIATYSLGRIIDINAPEAIIDRQGMLHVLFMRGRGSHVYHTIRPNGVPMKPIYYRNIGGRRPSLKVLRENGEAYVIGGMEYDPTAPVKTVRDNMRQLSERPAFLSDRLNQR